MANNVSHGSGVAPGNKGKDTTPASVSPQNRNTVSIKTEWDSNASSHWKSYINTRTGETRRDVGEAHRKMTRNGRIVCSVCGRDFGKASGGNGGAGGGGGGGEGGGGGGGGGGAGSSISSAVYTGTDDFPITPQAMYIYCPSRKETYMFDGVIKANHTMSLKLVEEISEGEEGKFVNNAKNEPNKVTFDVIMSEVYTQRNDLTKRAKSRSESALTVLNALKRDRELLEVVTNLMTYKDMLLAGISLTQDDGTTHFGFYGQLTFQEKTELKAEGGGTDDNNSASTSRTGSATGGRTPSIWVNWLGANAI